jgi:pimeloyl-ACP methyl ester carboxylesterase
MIALRSEARMKIERMFAMFALLMNLTAGPIAVSCVRESRPGSDRMVRIGSHRLEMHLEGKGSPTVVIDAGITDQLDKLRPLQERLARVTQVITYNRAGYGKSEPGPLPRHSGREAEELKALLEKASVPGPYVLVGHSLGALNTQVFASKYPDDVAGMVLLDPPPLSFILGQDYKDLRVMAERMTAEWQAMADSTAKSADARERARSSFFQMIASEHREMFGETARLGGVVSSFGDMPLVVLAAGKPNPAFGEVAEEYQKYWVGQSRALANRSTKGKFIHAEGSSHYLYLDVPELVAQNILSVVYEVRGGKRSVAEVK